MAYDVPKVSASVAYGVAFSFDVRLSKRTKSLTYGLFLRSSENFSITYGALDTALLAKRKNSSSFSIYNIGYLINNQHIYVKST